MKAIIIVSIFTAFAINALAQKESFDMVSYTPIKSWKKSITNDYVSFSVVNEAKGSFCSITIYTSTDGAANSKTNFDNSWQKMAAEPLGAGSPKMETPADENGWQLQTGSAQFNKGGLSGTATLVTATCSTKMVNMVILLNSTDYSKEVTDFTNSINIKKIPVTAGVTQQQSGNTITSSVVGIWLDNILETSGYVNGTPMYTAGYARKEYTFYANGTYKFLRKTWFLTVKDILFGYESGTWSVQGNKLTITPQKGKSQEWSKAPSGRTTEWGKLLKSENSKLTKTVYTFNTKYYSGSQTTALELYFDEPNDRELKSGKGPNDNWAHYSLHNESIIDLPPGFAMNDAVTTSAKATSTNNKEAPEEFQFAGSWSYSISENTFGASSSGYNTRQYTFKKDGTYAYVCKVFSSNINVLLLQYENGNYAVAGDQLIITPLSGVNEEWSKNKVHPDQWDKKLTVSKRKLEKVSYTFTLHYFSGIKETDLVLQTPKPTEREGSFGTIQDFPNGWVFKPCNTQNNPLIELPAGFSQGTNVDLSSNSFNKTAGSNTSVSSPITGKIFEGTSSEKFTSGTMNGYNTGGFSTKQYQFNPDGTYRFVSVLASHYTDTKTLEYETGTYTINGNQLTIIPTKGQNEEWSKTGKTSNGNSDVTNRAINESWNKKLKTTARKLEKYTYPFSIANNAEKTALVMERSNRTEREGEGKIAYLNEISSANAIPIPNGY